MVHITRRMWRGVDCLWPPGLSTELREVGKEGNKNKGIKRGMREWIQGRRWAGMQGEDHRREVPRIARGPANQLSK